ncbi:MAG TPA: hypothetical protein VFG68_16645 [Fimbriiglobus sp.]|nr:hypothetical protein [Fimbriiglobus sp.]
MSRTSGRPGRGLAELLRGAKGDDAAGPAGEAAGVPRKYAAEAAGIGYDCLRCWLVRGRKSRQSDREHGAFYVAYKKAEAKAVAVRVRRIADAAADGTCRPAGRGSPNCC